MHSGARNVRAVLVAAVLSVLVLFVAVVVSGPSQEVRAQGAAADYFLKIEGIDGESTVDGHQNWIELLGWSWGASNPTRLYGPGAGAGKVNMQDFHFTMRVSKATPKLMLAVAQGRRIPSATMVARGADGAPFITWELKNIIISSYNTSADRSTGLPTDEIKIRFTQIIVTYTLQNADGTTSQFKAGYDLALQKKV